MNSKTSFEAISESIRSRVAGSILIGTPFELRNETSKSFYTPSQTQVSCQAVRDRKDVIVGGVDVAQRLSEPERVFRVRTARALRVTDLMNDLGIGGWTEIVRIPIGGEIDERRNRRGAGIAEFDRNFGSVEAAALAVVEHVEDAGTLAGGYAVGHPPAAFPGRADQGDDPSGSRGDTAVICRALPESARPAADESRTPLDVRKRGAPDQGSVAKDPEISVDSRQFAHTGSVARDHALQSRCWTRHWGAVE